MMKKTLLAMVVPALALSAGCGDSSYYGDLLVHYRIGSGVTCDTAGIASIEVTLDGSEHDPAPSIAPCTDRTTDLLFRDVPVDVYDVTVRGLDEDGDPIFEGTQTGVTIVEGDVTETRTITLSVMNPSLRLIWTFPGGTMCGVNNVSALHVVLYRQSINIERDLDDVECQPGQFLIEDLFPDEYDIRVRAFDDTSGEYTFAFDRDGIDLTGAGTVQVVANLEACQGECTPP
jgi:hypothetical protein